MEESLEETLKKLRISVLEVAKHLNVKNGTIYYNLRHPRETAIKKQIRKYVEKVRGELRKIVSN